MNLYAPLQRSLKQQKYVTPTPIQAQAIPPAIKGRDILGCAQTGTGKTAAFALPILDFLGHENPPCEPNKPIALVMAPTRELAIQISESFDVYGSEMRFKQALVYGGVKQQKQVNALRRGVDVVIATPGRLQDLMEQKHINLANIQIFVLDEADRMLDMGFLPALKKIIAKLPSKRQSMFFSATLPPKIVELSNQLLFDPVSISIAPEKANVDLINQTVTSVEGGEKFNALRQMLQEDSVERTIVFTRTKHRANQVARKLANAGVRASAIHGNKSQAARQRAIEDFRNKKVTVLVATDVASRGIDIDDVTHVVNYDIPNEAESYVHRIGRTGRAGKQGIAISFCSSAEIGDLRAIEKLIGKEFGIAGTAMPKKKAGSSSHGNKAFAKRRSSRPNSNKRSNQRPGRSERRSRSASGNRG